MNPIIGILLRLVITYALFLIMLRIAGKRVVSMGSLGSPDWQAIGTPFDFVVALMISDLPDDMIYGEVPLAKGLVAIGTFILVHLLVNDASFRWPRFERLVAGSADPILKQGKPVRATMRRHRISNTELADLLRYRSVDKREEIEQADLEPSDTLSVQKKPWAKPVTRRDLMQDEET